MDKLTALALAAPPSMGIATALVQMGKPTLEMAKSEHQTLLIAASVATLGGAVIGYYVGHRKPDYDNAVFEKTLGDLELWSTLEKGWRDAYLEEIKLRKSSHNRRNRPSMTQDMSKEIEMMEESWAEVYAPAKEKSYLEKVFDLHPEIRELAHADWLVMPDDDTIEAPPKSSRQSHTKKSQ